MLGSRTVGNGSPRRASAQALLKPRPRIPAEHLTAIREAIDLGMFIGKNVPLHRCGKIFFGRCPWHESKSGRSFHVDPASGTWRCWGCRVGGDCFDFARRFYRISFRESVQLLAREAGIDLAAPLPTSVIEAQRKRAELATVDAARLEAEHNLLLTVRDQLHSANRARRNAIARLAAIEAGERERFCGEADAARELIALESDQARRLDTGYLILAFGSAAEREQFVTDPESREALIDAALHRGYIVDDRNHHFGVGL